MEWVKLTDICRPKQWKTIAGRDLLADGYPVYGANGLIGYWAEYNHEYETITIACRGTCGKVNIVPGQSYINGNAMCLDDLSDRFGLKFLYYYLKGYDFKDVITGTTIPQITIEGLQKVKVPCLPLVEQEEIVLSLTRVDTIIQLRQQQLVSLDDLIKARFVEMFGTLDKPSQPFNRDELRNLCTKITDGKHGGCTREEGTCRYFVGAKEIYDDAVHYDTAPEINIAEFEKDYKRCNVEKGDFLIVNTGATIGKSAIATDDRTKHTLLQKSVALLKVKPELLNPVFLKYCYIVNDKMYKVDSASAQPNLLLSKINMTEIYVPDMWLQEEFASFAAQVDKSKVAVQKSLDEAQLLFDSLMQKYFG